MGVGGWGAGGWVGGVEGPERKGYGWVSCPEGGVTVVGEGCFAVTRGFRE